MLFAEGEIGWDLIANHTGEKRNGVPAWNVFTKRHQVDLAVDLHALALF